MKNLYPKIKFIYSLPYNRILAEYENKDFNESQFFKEIKKYIEKLQPKWEKISKRVFSVLQEIVKNKWQEKEIQCYVVKYCKYSGISSPLTIRMEPDLDFAFEVIIHELTHIFIGYNFDKYKKINVKLKENFPGETLITRRHIYVNFIELQVLRKLFSQKILNKILRRNLSLRGIGKAWKIVLNQGENLKKLFKNSE